MPLKRRLQHNFSYLKAFPAFLVFVGMALIAGESMADKPLNNFLWSNRPVLIFGSPNDQNGESLWKTQLDMIADHRDGVLERDIVVLDIAPGSVSVILGDNDFLKPSLAFSAELYEFYDVNENDFAVILVGKDGTEKDRWSAPVKMTEIFERIDSMPMRQREMHQKEMSQSGPKD